MSSYCGKPKHKTFCPTCADCRAKRDNVLNTIQTKPDVKIKTEINKTPEIEEFEKEEGEKLILTQLRRNVLTFTQLFEKVIVSHQNLGIIHLFFVIMNELNYTFVAQINPNLRTDTNVYLIFKKNVTKK